MPVPAFPLDTAGWLPVLWTPPATATATSAGGGGSLPGRVGLRTVLERSHEISALAIAEPPAYAAVLRVLYALTARVCGLDVDDDSSGRDWSERRLDILDAGRLPADGIDAYFSSWAGRFDLFDPGRPWMQDPRLAEQCDPARSAGVNKLTPTRASGNNHAWFSKVQDTDPDPVPAGEAALSLLTWHYWGPSGRGSAREAGGERTASMMAGPLRGALSYHPEGETLFESLLAGLLRPDPRVRREEDACMWEWDALPDPTAAPAAPTGPCSRLTAVSQHALLLVPDPHDPGLVGDAFITWAYRERLPRNDPYLIWQMSQQGNAYPRPADAGRALWRDIDALLLTQPGGTAQVHRPEVFATAVEISDATPRPLAVRALGFDQDGQAKDRQFVTGLTPPVLDSVEEENPATAPAVGWLRRCGEMYGRRAEYAARRACALYMRENKPKEAEAWAAQAAALYWPRAEEEFWVPLRAS
ncbi:CRISPR system Cascade subunit CasA [Streptomyces sp. SAI-170]|uniref:type I-E CRISPR-associated protein Cse1/CasA n=1 Tax=Streptomyces sp. SAI-170 TaxID=3377729 RepID=UPI003C7B3AD4